METITHSGELVNPKIATAEIATSENVSLAVAPDTLSLKALHERLQARGVEMSYKVLSEFVGTGDGTSSVAELLGATGGRKAFPPVAVDVLAAFLPVYKEKRGRLPQLPQLLRDYLSTKHIHEFTGSGKDLTVGGGGETEMVPAQDGGGELARNGETARNPFTAIAQMMSPLTAVLGNLEATLREMRQDRQQERQITTPAPVADRLLTPEQAAEMLACKPRSVGNRVPPVERNPSRYRESDVLRHIASLEQKPKTEKI